MAKSYKSPAIHRTALYRAKAAYSNMRARCLNKNGKNKSYKNVELKMSLNEWLQYSIPLYQDFIDQNPNVTPNVSRYNDTGHYEIGNIEIVSKRVNVQRQRERYSYRVNSDNQKICSRCRLQKDSSKFSKNRTTYDGLSGWCKDCKKIQHKIYKAKKAP